MSGLIRTVIKTARAPGAIGPYSQAVAVNDTLYISGQLGILPESMVFAGNDVEAQTHQALKNISAILDAAHLSMKNVVKTTVLLSDMNNFAKVNEIYGEYPYPARAAFQVACLPKNAMVEIEAIAAFGTVVDNLLFALFCFPVFRMNSAQKARYRWKTLAAAVRGQKSKWYINTPDVLHLNGLAETLFETRDISPEVNEESHNSSKFPAVRWVEYIPNTRLEFADVTNTEKGRENLSSPESLHLRMYCNVIVQPLADHQDNVNLRLKTLSGFDNTGNVHIWSSELLLAHALLCASVYPGLYRLLSELFSKEFYQRICELGAGMTGAAGLAVCTPGKQIDSVLRPVYMLLTDGNERCVQSLKENVRHQITRFQTLSTTGLRIEARHLSWAIEDEIEQSELDASLVHSFDLLLAADCFFNPAGHRGLMQLIDMLLSHDRRSAFVAIAPWRGSTLKQFLQLITTGQSLQWKVTRLEPEMYMHPRLYRTLSKSLESVPFDRLKDNVIVCEIAVRPPHRLVYTQDFGHLIIRLIFTFVLGAGFLILSFVLFTKLFEVKASTFVLEHSIMAQVSPIVKKMQWGSIVVQRLDEKGVVVPDAEVTYRDAKLWPGGSRAWDWRETGTGHFPGIQTTDVDELLTHNPETIVLSQGVLHALQVPQSTVDYIKKQLPNVEVVVRPSKKAFELYNELASKGVRVAALIHTTC
ncbi:Enamine/imine deaminase [Fasciola hepatica]|uniref:Mth938 domain-containing protein n=1 Tax=Fasciola hepatica TaxID=6192 RepID=A0A4E0RAH0_FASHE|nr:Enamine/imine deaminase [Fasciola hepatica]